MRKMMLAVVGMMIFAVGVYGQVNGFDVLRSKYEASKATIEADCVKAKDSAKIAYGNALVVAMQSLKSKGDLNGYLTIEKEKKRFDISSDIPSTSNDSVISPIVIIYWQFVKKADSDSDIKRIGLIRSYILYLEDAVKASMLADKIDDAKAVKAELDRVTFELSDLETRLPKTEMSKTNGVAEVEPPKVGLLVSGGKKIVLWNMHNGHMNNSGTLSCDVTLYSATKVVWEAKGVEIPWKPNEDCSMTTNIPAGIRFDRIHVDITKWQGVAGGLSEIQVFDGKRNIAEHCKATASGFYQDSNGTYPPERATDGNTSSGVYGKGYWHLPLGQPGWVEVDLTKKASSKDKRL